MAIVPNVLPVLPTGVAVPCPCPSPVQGTAQVSEAPAEPRGTGLRGFSMPSHCPGWKVMFLEGNKP